MQLHRETPQPRKRICRFVTDRKQRLLHIFIVRLVRECTQGKEQCRQRLPALVVQLHCDSLTLLLLRCHDMPQEETALLRSLTQMPLHIVHRIRQTPDLIRRGECDRTPREMSLGDMLCTFHKMMEWTRQDLRQAKDQNCCEEQDNQRDPHHFQHIGDQQFPQCILAHPDTNCAECPALDRPANVLDLPKACVHAQYLRLFAALPVQFTQV